MQQLLLKLKSWKKFEKVFLLLQFFTIWQLRIKLSKFHWSHLLYYTDWPILSLSSAWLVCRCVCPLQKEVRRNRNYNSFAYKACRIIPMHRNPKIQNYLSDLTKPQAFCFEQTPINFNSIDKRTSVSSKSFLDSILT